MNFCHLVKVGWKVAKLWLNGRALSFGNLSMAKSFTRHLVDLIADVHSSTLYTFPKYKKKLHYTEKFQITNHLTFEHVCTWTTLEERHLGKTLFDINYGKHIISKQIYNAYLDYRFIEDNLVLFDIASFSKKIKFTFIMRQAFFSESKYCKINSMLRKRKNNYSNCCIIYIHTSTHARARAHTHTHKTFTIRAKGM